MPDETQTCEHCNTEFSYTRVRKYRRYCSRRCKHKAHYHRNVDVKKYKERSKKYRNNNPIKFWLYSLQKRAKAKGVVFDLDESDLVIPKLCPVLGIPLERNTGGRGHTSNSPSIDRIDPTKGYTKDNVKVISMRANQLKSDGTVEELSLVLDYMKGAASGVPL